MRYYRFLFDQGESTIKAETLGQATLQLAEMPAAFAKGYLRTVECGVDSGAPEFQRKTFTFEGEDAKYLIQWDADGPSGDGRDEPHTPAHAWIADLWIWQAYERPANEYRKGRWVRIHEELLKPSLREAIESECYSQAFPDE